MPCDNSYDWEQETCVEGINSSIRLRNFKITDCYTAAMTTVIGTNQEGKTMKRKNSKTINNPGGTGSSKERSCMKTRIWT
jgi:hypothetical protein